MLPDTRTAYSRIDVRIVPAVVVIAVLVWVLTTQVTSRSPLTVVALGLVGAGAGVVTALLLRGAVEMWCAGVEIAFDTRRDAPTAAALTGVLWAAAVTAAGGQSYLPAWLAVSAVAVWAALIDQRTMRIPSVLCYWAGAAAAVLLLFAGVLEHDLPATVRGVVAGLTTAVLYLLVAIATRGGMGLGDVRLGFSLGAVLGYISWTAVCSGIVIPVFLMFPIALWRLLRGRTGDGMAAGPYLVAGCVVALSIFAL